MIFYHKSMEFDVPDNVYEPREDSLLLAEILEKEDLAGKKCLDMGSGCGFLSILMAKQGAEVIAADINKDAVEVTRNNASRNNALLTAVRSDLFENVKDEYDLIVFNAPYLPSEEKEKDEQTYYGGPTGRAVIERFLVYAKQFLKPEGKILLLFSTLTGEDEITEKAQKEGFTARSTIRQKVPWESLVVVELSHR